MPEKIIGDKYYSVIVYNRKNKNNSIKIKGDILCGKKRQLEYGTREYEIATRFARIKHFHPQAKNIAEILYYTLPHNLPGPRFVPIEIIRFHRKIFLGDTTIKINLNYDYTINAINLFLILDKNKILPLRHQEQAFYSPSIEIETTTPCGSLNYKLENVLFIFPILPQKNYKLQP